METGYDEMNKVLSADKNKKVSDMKRLMTYLAANKKIDPLTALDKFGIYRLGARIHDMRWKYGWNIKTTFTPSKTNPDKEITIYEVVSPGGYPK